MHPEKGKLSFKGLVAGAWEQAWGTSLRAQFLKAVSGLQSSAWPKLTSSYF